MTLKQEKTIQLLPENNMNLAQAMRQAGYKESVVRSGEQYHRIRKHIANQFNQEEVKRKIIKYERKFLKDGDNSNLARMIELQAKATHLTTDNNINQLNIIEDKDIKALANRANVNEQQKAS